MGKKIYLNSVISYREDTLENWTIHNPLLEKGEPSIVNDAVDGNWLKIGDGVTKWIDLPYKKWSDGSNIQIDQTYNPESSNAQSGKAVAEANRFKKLLSTEVTQEEFDEANGKIGVITLGGENISFDGINQLRFLIFVPKSSDINTTECKLAIRSTIPPNVNYSDSSILLRGNGGVEYTSVKLVPDFRQRFSVTLDFIDNILVQGICVKNLYSSYTYGASAYGWTTAEGNMGRAKYIHILSYELGVTSMTPFYFPVGTTVEIYGR